MRCGQQDRFLKKAAAEKDEMEFLRFFFMSTDEESAPMLILKSSQSVKVFAKFLEQTETKKFMNFSDNEAALVRLKEEASRRLLKEVECVPRTCPVGDHQANGLIESAVKGL